MAISIGEFWDLLAKSRLLAPDELERQRQAFSSMKGAAQIDSSRTLAEWLVAEGAVGRYHTTVLLAGRWGPFYYGDYRIVDRVESGRLAGAFRAVHIPSGHGVLLSFFTGPMTENAALWANAVRAFHELRGASSPHLMRLHEIVDLATFKFAAVEDPRGETLERIAAGTRLPPDEAMRLVRRAALGLSRLHAAGICHGDVRPENIWIEPRGNAKLLLPPITRDLTAPPGVVQLAAPDSERLLRAADYLAPELSRPGAAASPASDIYALGCAFYELLAGAPPFAGGSTADKAYRHATQPPPSLQECGVSPELERLVLAMMAKDPAARFRDIGPILDALAAFAEPGATVPPEEDVPPTLAAYEGMLAEKLARQIEAARQPRVPEPPPEVVPSFVRAQASPFDFEKKRNESAPQAIVVDPARAATASPRRKSSLKSTVAWFLAAVLAAVGGMYVFNLANAPATSGGDKTAKGTNGETSSDENEPAGAPKKNPPGSDNLADVAAVRETAVPDDGQSLWASPTAGEPIRLAHLPPGAQIFLAVRPAELVATEEGNRLVAALGPTGDWLLKLLKSATGFEPSEIEQVLVGLRAATPGGPLTGALVVRLREKQSEENLVARWPGAQAATHDGKTYYTADGWAYYIPPGDEGRTFAVAPVDEIGEVIAAGNAPPPLRREMEKMLPLTDASRHITLLFAPNYLFSDAKEAIFAGPMERLRKPLDWYLGDGIQAVQLSFHFDQNFFAEFRAYSTLDTRPLELARQFQARLDEIPGMVEEYIVSLNPQPYGRFVLRRFPDMIKQLDRYARSGEENDQALVRAYLPLTAAHNLAMGTELTLAETPGGAAAATTTAPTKTPAPTGIEAALAKRISISFPRDTLESAIRMVGEELGVPVVILGGDLQLDGITKNQSFGIDLRDAPGKEVLEKIVVLANPDKTSDAPNHPAQKLVYVVKADESGAATVYITTRAQAEKRGDPLPEAFKQK